MPCHGVVKTNQRTMSSTDVPATRDGHRATEQAGQVEHPTMAERAARGKAERKLVPLSAHGEWQPSSDRPDPVSLLEEQATSRVPELVPIRYGRMLVSPFTFYRGAAYLMASDLASTPRTGLSVQLCGDAHLSNFGVFAAPDRRLIFSVNDFDETLPGPFEWDVKRLVASFAVAGRDRDFDTKQRKSINLAVARSYREAMQDMAQMKKLDVWYARMDIEEIDAQVRANEAQEVKRFEKNVAKARSKDSMKAFDKLVQVVDGRPQLVGDPPLIVPIEDLFPEYQQVDEAIHAFAARLSPHARRRSSTPPGGLPLRARGPQGGRCGQRGHSRVDRVDAGQRRQRPAVPAGQRGPGVGTGAFLGEEQISEPRAARRRRSTAHAVGQRYHARLVRTDGIDGVSRDFYIRQLWDGKGSAIVEAMKPSAMTAYAGLCGWTLARAHARSGDAAAIASYLGTGDRFDRAMARFAETYADQNERDYAALKQAVDSGKVAAESA